MIRITSFAAALFAAVLPGCAVAQQSLEDRVSVERQTISIDALRNILRRDNAGREEARAVREAPVRVGRNELLNGFEQQAENAVFLTRFDILPGFQQFSPWQVEGRVTQDSALYVALPFNWQFRNEGRDDITLCTVRFDTQDAAEFDHSAVLFLVLSAGGCSSDRLTDSELLADLTAPVYAPSETEPLTVQVRAEREFSDASMVEVLASDSFKPIYDWRFVSDDLLGGEDYRQILMQQDGAGTRAWVETGSGEVLTFFQSREVQSAICVNRGPSAGQLFEINIGQAAFIRDTTPPFQRFCLEQLNAIDEEYSDRLRRDTRPITTRPIGD